MCVYVCFFQEWGKWDMEDLRSPSGIRPPKETSRLTKDYHKDNDKKPSKYLASIMSSKKRKPSKQNKTLEYSEKSKQTSKEKRKGGVVRPMGILSVLVTVVAIYFSRQTSVIQTEERYKDFDGVAIVTENYKVLKVVDHDPTAFTQGLQSYNDHQLIESTGIYGESLIRIWEPENGKIVKETPKLDSKYFGEGLTWYQDEEGNDRYVMLTWREFTAMIYDRDLNLVSTFEFKTRSTEGWGITFDPVQRVFYVSDGTAHILVWDLKFREISWFVVTLQLEEGGKEQQVPKLNELEWDPEDGTLLANVWYEDVILRILPRTGQVVQVYNFRDLYTNRAASADCLNGIAFHSANKWWITGKLWPHLYLVEIFP